MSRSFFSLVGRISLEGMDKVRASLKDAEGNFIGLKTTMLSAGRQFGAFGKAFENTANTTGVAGTRMGNLYSAAAAAMGEQSGLLRERILGVTNTLREEGAQLKANVEALKKSGASLQEVADAEAKLADVQKKAAETQEEYATRARNLAKAFEDGRRIIEQSESPLEKYNRRLSDINEAHRLGAIDAKTQKAAIADLNKEYGVSAEQLSKYAAVVSAVMVGMGVAVVKAGIDFETAFAGVRKTVDATEEEFQMLSDGIRNLAKEMPQSASAIAGVAEAAGQLGIKTENILDFTKTMIMLGDATNLSSDAAATALARFANIVGMSQDKFGQLGSAIVSLGNNFATTEAEIVSMGMRLAGAGAQIGLSEADIMGLATALSAVGISAEAGGSAFSKVMIQMQLAVETTNEDLEKFASVAGVSAEQFQKAFGEDAVGAIQLFLDGLNNVERNGMSAIAVLEDMGITEVRMRDALLRGAGAAESFGAAIRLSNEAWAEGGALQREAAQRYETTAAQLSILKNRVVDIGLELSETLLPIMRDSILPLLQSMAGLLGGLAKMFTSLPAPVQTAVITLGAFAATVGVATLATTKFITATKNVPVAMTVLKKSLLAGTAAVGKFTVALLANPYTAAIAGVVALTAAIWHLVEAEKARARITQQYNEMFESLEDLRNEIGKMTAEAREMERILHESAENFNIDQYNVLVESIANATVEYENLERAMKRQQPLTKKEESSIRERILDMELRAFAVREYYENHLPKVRVAEATNLKAEEAAEAKRKEWASAAKKRREELAALISAHKEALEIMHLNEIQMLERDRAIQIRRAIALGATYEEVKIIAERYYQDIKKIEEDLYRQAQENERKKAEAIIASNEAWHLRLLQQSDMRYEILELEHRKAVEAANKIGADTVNIDKYYTEEKRKIAQEFNDEITKIAEQHMAGEKKRMQARENEEKKWSDAVSKQRGSRVEILKAEMNESLKIAHDMGAEKKNIYAYYLREINDAERKMAQETARNIQQTFDTIKTAAVDLVNSVNGIFGALSKREEQRIDREYKKRMEALERTKDANVNYEAEMAALRQEQEEEKNQIARDTVKREKAVGVLTATVNTASAIIKALADPGGLAGVALSIAAGITGAAQIATIAATPLPQLYDGGLLQGSRDGQIIQAGERNQAELILPLERGVEILAEKLNAIQGGGSSNTTINLNTTISAGNIIADRHSEKVFAQRINEHIVAELKRTGVA